MGKKSISTRTRSRMIYKSTILVVILILSLSSLMIFVNAVDDSSQENLYFTFKFSEPNLMSFYT